MPLGVPVPDPPSLHGSQTRGEYEALGLYWDPASDEAYEDRPD